MKKPIKVIKRGDVREEPPSPPEADQTAAEIDRDLQNSVNSWIDERRRNGEAETSVAAALLRGSR